MRNKRNVWTLIVLLLAGALIGGITGQLLSQYPNFAWMSFNGKNGYRELFAVVMDPLVDSHLVKFGFNFAIRINFGSILGMVLGIFTFIRIKS